MIYFTRAMENDRGWVGADPDFFTGTSFEVSRPVQKRLGLSMSAFAVIADVAIALRNVRLWPKADVDHCTATQSGHCGNSAPSGAPI